MSLSFREKQRFYHNLAQLVRSGIPFPTAIGKLTQSARGTLLGLLRKLGQHIAAGKTVGEAFALERPAVTTLEAAVIQAVEKSGRLEHGMQELAQYFGALAQARAIVLKRLGYPLFVLHFGVIILATPKLFLEGAGPFFAQVLGTLVYAWAGIAIVAMLSPMLGDIAAGSAFLDRVLRLVPGVGKIRRAFAVSRFCTVYEIQLDAGVNVIDALALAGRASRSGLVRAATERVLPEVRQGAQVGPLLAISGAFPKDVASSIIVGEETGALDRELLRVAAEQREEALSRMETLAEWVPKLLYVVIVVYLGYQIIGGYKTMLDRMMNTLG